MLYKMNIIIPLGGKGERFKNNGYLLPKPLIKVFDKEMIFYVLDNLKINLDDKIFIIYYNLEEYDFENIILKKYPFINFITLNKQTLGASETIMIGLEQIIKISTNKKCLLLDCDKFYTQDILLLYRDVNENAVFYTTNTEIKPIYSYIKLDEKLNIEQIIEKV
jgi:dTDP-glucose pyrophosphorylase